MATLGKTGIGAISVRAAAGYINAFKQTMSTAGHMTALSFYCRGNDRDYGHARLCLYDHNAGNDRPGTLLASVVVSIPAKSNAAWRSGTISVDIAVGTYWLAHQNETDFYLYYDHDGSRHDYKASAYSLGAPTPFGTCSNDPTNTQSSLYATYTANSAPSAPTGLGATSANLTPVFTGTHSDPDSDAMTNVQIIVTRVSDGATMWDSGKVAATGATFSKTYAGSALAYNTAYQWKARTWDAWDAAGAYSALQNLTITHAPPAPTSLSPTGWITDLTPDITGTFSDSDGHTLSAYQIILYDDAAGTSVVWDSGELATGIVGAVWTKTYNGSALANGTQYYWKARNKCSNGDWGSYSALQAMNTNGAPTASSSLDPPDATQVGTAAPTLTWIFEDPDGGDTQSAYQVEIRLVSDSSLVHDSTKTASGTASYAVPAATLTASVASKWRVKCWDSADLAGAWSGYNTITYMADVRAVTHHFYNAHRRLPMRAMTVLCFDSTSWELKGTAVTDGNGLVTFADLPRDRRYILMAKHNKQITHDERLDAASVSGYEAGNAASELLLLDTGGLVPAANLTGMAFQPTWLASPVGIINGSAYTTNLANPTALSIAAAVPASAAWALVSITMADSGAADAWYSAGSNEASGVVCIQARTSVADRWSTPTVWIPVTSQNIYVRRAVSGTMTVWMSVFAWSP